VRWLSQESSSPRRSVRPSWCCGPRYIICFRRRASKVTVFGSGSFGTAMSTVLARNGFNVVMLSRRDEVSKAINREHRNATHFTSYPLPFNVRAETSAEKALADTDLIVHSIPVQATAGYLEQLRDLIPPDVPIVNTSKGLHTTTLKMMSDIIPHALGRPDHPVAFFSGPTFAKELMEGWPTGAVIAAKDDALANRVAASFRAPALRVWTTDDVVGVEVAGALKNVYAIASGIVEGLGLGLNTTSLLVTRAIAEMNLVATALGARSDTLVGLGGIGDLMLTSYGGLSRNRTVGVRLGRGETMADIMASATEVAEGVATTPAAFALTRKHQIRAPIIESVHYTLQGLISPVDALMSLMEQYDSGPRGTGFKAERENILGPRILPNLPTE
jgi:glycerol-3-phosphate dehydrogenase (NAD+)